MDNVVKCPRCGCDVDVTSFAVGSTVRCSDCGGMMRVPTGRTGVHSSVKAKTTTTRPRTAAVPAAAAPQPLRQTGTRMRQAAVGRGTAVRRKSSSSTTYVLLGILALAIIVVGVIFVLGTPSAPPPEPAPAAKAPPKPPAPRPEPAPAPAPPPAAEPVKAPAPEAAPRGDEAARTNWLEILTNLRGGGAFDLPDRPEHVYFTRVQRMGKSAYPHLVRFIDDEDPALGRAAVALLNALTNQNKPLPTGPTKAKVKEEWQAWVAANP